jgi:hypothetical protein
MQTLGLTVCDKVGFEGHKPKLTVIQYLAIQHLKGLPLVLGHGGNIITKCFGATFAVIGRNDKIHQAFGVCAITCSHQLLRVRSVGGILMNGRAAFVVGFIAATGA